ncbi:MAG: tetratricopeptide repeat protein [Acidobacteriota bacterium]
MNLTGLSTPAAGKPVASWGAPPVTAAPAQTGASGSLSEKLQQAMALHQQGRLDLALSAYQAILAAQPDHAEAHNLLGILHYQRKDMDAAVASLTRARDLDPNHAGIQTNLGNVLKAVKQYEAAVACYQKAIALKPGDSMAHNNLGTVLNDLKRHEAALACFDRAAALQPNDPMVHYNRGNALFGLGRNEAALASYDKALSLKPNHAESHFNRGTALDKLKQYESARQSYSEAIALNPAIEFVHGARMIVKRRICDWSLLDDETAFIAEQIEKGKRVCQPFYVMSSIDSPRLQKKAAELYVQARFPADSRLGALAPRATQGKIRIGYFSADFRDHPVAFLTAQLFETHDRSRFELFAFSFQKDLNSTMRPRLVAAFDQFLDVHDKTVEEVAQLARSLNIDIAVDLGGLTDGSRTGVFALRAAPAQINYIGYPGTMGASYIDYILADPVVLPPDQAGHYTEKAVYLPCFQVNDTSRAIADKVFTRAELGLPETGFVFCSFNQTYKISPETFDGWMRIMREVKDSVLLILAEEELTQSNLRKEAAQRDVDPKRLVFCGRLPSPEYLARCRVGDLFLDSYPYNAGTTASDALWAGLPVLTRAGQSYCSRMAAALLTGIGLPELITHTQQDYEALAIELATHPSKLQDLRARLADNRACTPLFDTPLFTRSLEEAYLQMHARTQQGLPPQVITVTK